MSNTEHPGTDYSAVLKELTFSGPSTVAWKKEKWVESRASYYVPTLKIDKALPVSMTLKVKVMEDRRFVKDPKLGHFFAKFPAGKTTAEVWTENNSLAQSRGFPAKTPKKFWLVAGKKKRIRGNTGRGDDDHAKVYIEAKSPNVKTMSNGKTCALIVRRHKSARQSARKTVKVKKV